MISTGRKTPLDSKRRRMRPVHLTMGILFFLTVLLIAHRFLDHKEIGLIWERLAPGFIPILVGLPAVYMWLKSGRYVNLFAVSGPPLEGARERDLTRLSYLSAQMVTLLPGGYVARVHD